MRRHRRTSPQNQNRTGKRTEHFASPATAFARSVLPVPGGPTQQRALWQLRTDLRIFARGLCRKSTTSCRDSFASSSSGYILKRNTGLFLHVNLGFALADTHNAASAASASCASAGQIRIQSRTIGSTKVRTTFSKRCVPLHDLPACK